MKLVDYVKQYSIDTIGLHCQGLPGSLYILVKRDKNYEAVCLLKRYNSFLSKDTILSYPIDSLEKWTLNSFPNKAIPKISFLFPFCINNQIEVKEVSAYLIPLKTSLKMTYNDSLLNIWTPLKILTEHIRFAEFENDSVYVFKQNYTSQKMQAINIKVKENGVFQKSKIINNLRY